jgi:steroid delta-isomerase-like uncharacterized protein
MSTEDNKAATRRFFEEVWSQGNLTVVDELCAPNFIYHTPLGPIHGLEGFKQFANMYRTAFPDVRVQIEDQIAEEDRVATRWVASGTHEGELMGIAPTGNRVTVAGMTIDRIANGQVVETWDNYDALGMMQQIGAIPSE